MRHRLASLFLAAVTCLACPALAAVGFQYVEIADPQGKPIEVGIWYPTHAQPSVQRLELGVQTVAPDGEVAGSKLPLILISHGHGGSYTGHADTAAALAEAGYVAAALTHNGDSWRDDSRATALWDRPRQLKLLDDFMLTQWRDHDRIDPHRIGAFGFSAGGFTVLAAAGGEPDLGTFGPHCSAHPDFEDCHIAVRHRLPPSQSITWVHDPRIRAVVSAAPAIGFAFGKKGLEAVTVPVQLWRAADDTVLPQPFYAEAVQVDLPHPPEMHVVARAGHYDFLAPCSEGLRRQVPAICTSAPGFDRAGFHEALNRDVIAFFGRSLRD